MSALRRIVAKHGRFGAVEYAGRKYVAHQLAVMPGSQVIVEPVNHTAALVHVFSTRTFLSICYAQNRNLWRRLPAKKREQIILELARSGARRVSAQSEISNPQSQIHEGAAR